MRYGLNFGLLGKGMNAPLPVGAWVTSLDQLWEDEFGNAWTEV